MSPPIGSVLDRSADRTGRNAAIFDLLLTSITAAGSDTEPESAPTGGAVGHAAVGHVVINHAAVGSSEPLTGRVLVGRSVGSLENLGRFVISNRGVRLRVKGDRAAELQRIVR